MYPAHLRPPDQQYHWRRIEHADGVMRDWHSLLVPADRWANLTPVEQGWEVYVNDLGAYYWAAGLHEGKIEGLPAVVRVVAEWDGPMGSEPPMVAQQLPALP